MPFVICCLFLSIIHSVLHNLVLQDAKQLLRGKLIHGLRPFLKSTLLAAVVASSAKKINDCLCVFMYFIFLFQISFNVKECSNTSA